MKKMILILIVICLTLAINSCSKNKDASCQTCNTVIPDYEKPLTLVNKLGTKISVDMQFWKTAFNNKPDFYYSTYKNNQSEDEYDRINSFMANIVGENVKDEFLAKNNYCFTLYLDGDISRNQIFEEKDILGFNIYHVKDNFLYHKFFVKSETGFVEKKRLSVRVKGVDIAEIYRLADNYFKPKTNSIIAVNVGITDHSKIKEFKHSDEVPENLKLKMAFDLSSKNFFNRNGETDDDLFEQYYRVEPIGDNCPSPCSLMANHQYCQPSFPDPSASCKKKSGVAGGGCRLKSAALMLSREIDDTNLSDSLHSAYNLRDNFLANSTRGNFYNDSYYYISNSMSSLSLPETVNLGKIYVEEEASTLNLFMSGSKSSILYSDSIAVHTIAAINTMKFKIPSTDTLGIKIMDWYLTQVSKYKDSTILSIKSNF